jgi:hypothetical protein
MEEEELYLDQVANLIDSLDQAPWVEWGLWGDEALEGQQVRIQAPDFADPESTYLEEKEPPLTPTFLVQQALSKFLGRDQ